VTCSATGAEITIDKCALTGVDASSIHLKDTACSATEVDANTWKIATGFSDCGSEFGFATDKLTLQNTLTIGHSIVTGRVISRKYEIDFSCNYNNIAEASTTIQASNTLYGDLTFDLNSAQPGDLSFEFELDFYHSDEYSSQADLTNGAFQPGTLVYGKIAPTSALSDLLEFSVGKCTVEDKTIAQSLDILDTCPVEHTNFEFKDSQSDQSAVKFSFETFVFPDSAVDTAIDVTCTINICPLNSDECLKICSEGECTQIHDEKGLQYGGSKQTTINGRTCQKWNSQAPHSHSLTDIILVTYGEEDVDTNFCRNVDHMARPWCFTTDPDQRWEYCDIPTCETVANPTGCVQTYDERERNYVGFKQTTVSGRTCQKWNSQTPHTHSNTETQMLDLYDEEDFDTNFCRNPDNMVDGAWCYTTDPNVRWEYCDIPTCETDNAQVGCIQIYDQQGLKYKGTKQTTESGRTCQTWWSQTPHSHEQTDNMIEKFGEGDLETNNCRNPDGMHRPWCFTTDPNVRWEYCDIPSC